MSNESEYSELIKLGKVRFERGNLIKIQPAMTKNKVTKIKKPESEPGDYSLSSEFDEEMKQRKIEEQNRRHSSYIPEGKHILKLTDYIPSYNEEAKKDVRNPSIKFVLMEDSSNFKEFGLYNLRIGDHNLLWKNKTTNQISTSDSMIYRDSRINFENYYYNSRNPGYQAHYPQSRRPSLSKLVPNLKVSHFSNV